MAIIAVIISMGQLVIKSLTREAKEDPGHAIRAALKNMDFWVLSAYVLTPLLLGTLDGIELILFCIVIFPLISIIFFIVGRRY